MEKRSNEVYTIVTNRIIEQLQKNIVPWQQPWTQAGYPQNMVTKIPYRGINVFLLTSLGYAQNYFLTWKQLKALGGSLKKNEKGHLVVFWLPPSKQEEKEEQDTEPMPVLRYYMVFNISQCTGIPEIASIPDSPYSISSIGACEEIIERYDTCPEIKHSKHAAFYDRLADYINMPKQKTFKSTEAYYSTLFHELIHSTGHQSRLNRKGIVDNPEFGQEMYSQEELVAEIGACFLNAIAGIDTTVFDNSVAYINGWLEALQNNARMVVFAAIQAQKAVEYMLGFNPYEKPEPFEEDLTFKTH